MHTPAPLRRILPALSLMASLGLTACGGGDDSTSAATGGGSVTNGLTISAATDTTLNRSWTFALSGYYAPTTTGGTWAFNNNSGETDPTKQLEFEIDVDSSNQVLRAAVWHYPDASTVIFYACDNQNTDATYHCGSAVSVDATAKTGKMTGAKLYKITSGSLFLGTPPVVFGTDTVTVTGAVH